MHRTIQPGYDVKLLGIDLSTPGYFYDEAFTPGNRDQWADEKHEHSIQVGSHACARPKRHNPVTLVDVVACISAEFQRQGLSILDCNPNSLLVTEGVTPSAPVIG